MLVLMLPSATHSLHYASPTPRFARRALRALAHLDRAELAAGLESQDSESLRNHHLLLSVVRGRDTLKELDALEGSSTTGSLVGHHSTDGSVEDPAWCTEVEGTALLWVYEMALVQEVVVAELQSEE